MNKRLGLLVTFFLLVFLIFLFTTLSSKNYTYEYRLKDIKIKEEYNKHEKIYYYEIKTKNEIYEYALSHKYVRKRGLLDKVTEKKGCITAKSDFIGDFSVCKSDKTYSTTYANKSLPEIKVKDKYENIEIYNLLDFNYLIWNYNNFVALNNNERKTIKLFENDVYILDLITVYDHYLVVADYNEKYKFDILYTIDFKNFKTDTLKLDREIYFNSYILGNYKKYLYWYDIEKQKEYKINMKKGIVQKNNYEILKDGKFEKVSAKKLDKKELYFEQTKNFEYIISDGILYYKTPVSKIKITDMKVSNIIMQENDVAFFIYEDSLYHVSLKSGITKVLTNSEWIFNNKNIYVYNNN